MIAFKERTVYQMPDRQSGVSANFTTLQYFPGNQEISICLILNSFKHAQLVVSPWLRESSLVFDHLQLALSGLNFFSGFGFGFFTDVFFLEVLTCLVNFI